MDKIDLIKKAITIENPLDTSFSGKELFMKSLLNGKDKIIVKKDNQYFYKSQDELVELDITPSEEIENIEDGGDNKDSNGYRTIKNIDENIELVKKGHKYYVKKYIDNVDYLKAIALSFKLYSIIGINVSNLEKIDTKNGILYLEYIEGVNLGEYFESSNDEKVDLISYRLSKSYLANCIISNENVLGEFGQNIIIDKDDVPYIINIDSCFGFNKDGIKDETWGNNDCDEIFTYKDSFINPITSYIFKKVNFDELNVQLGKIDIFKEFSDQDYGEIMKNRYKNIYNYLKEQHNITYENKNDKPIYKNIDEIKNISVKNFYIHLNKQLPYTELDKQIIQANPEKIFDKGISDHFSKYGFDSQKGSDDEISKFCKDNGMFYFEGFVIKMFLNNQDVINSYLNSCIHSLEGSVKSGNFIDKGKTVIKYPDFNNVISHYNNMLKTKEEVNITSLEKQAKSIFLVKIITNAISRAEYNQTKHTYKTQEPFTLFRIFKQIENRESLFTSLKDCKMFIHNLISTCVYGIKSLSPDELFTFFITTNNGLKIDSLGAKENTIIQKPFMPYSIDSLYYDEGDDKYYVNIVDKSIM